MRTDRLDKTYSQLADGADAGHLVGAVRARGRTERGRDILDGVGLAGASQRDLVRTRTAAQLIAQQVPGSDQRVVAGGGEVRLLMHGLQIADIGGGPLHGRRRGRRTGGRRTVADQDCQAGSGRDDRETGEDHVAP